MYYSFYMNERLLLDNWREYDEVNWLLTNLLCKDDRKTIEEKADFYFANRHERGELFVNDDGSVYREEERYEVYDFNVDTFKRSMTYREERCKAINTKLREIDEVVLYKSDFDAIEKARKEYRLTELQTQILFGMIFFSRMNNIAWCRIGTLYKLRSFKACFEKTIKQEDIFKIAETGLFKQVVTNKDEAKYKLKEQAEYLHIETEADWYYLNFDNQDEVAYVFKTTLENNRLNLTKLAKEVIPDFKAKYCIHCGAEFYPKSNRQKMCDECKVIVIREQARLRKQKQRQKDR